MPFNFPDPQTTPEFTADNGITYSWDADDSKWQVKTTAALEDIRQDIIELEEEIDALAPSVERGSWTFNDSGVITGTGIFTAYDKPIAQAGNPTGVMQSIQSVWIHSIDSAGTRHGFADVKQGQLLEIFVEGSPDYGLFEVLEAHDYTDGAGDYWIIDVGFVRSLENTTRFNNDDLCRFKIFQAPTGGDISELAPPTPVFLRTPAMRIHSVDNVPVNISASAGEIQPLSRFTTQGAEYFYVSDTKYFRVSKDIFEEAFPDGIENYTFMPGQMLFYGADHQQSAAKGHPSNQGIYMAMDFQLVNERYYEITVNGTAGVIQDPAFTNNKYNNKSTYRHFLSLGCFWRNS